MLWWISRAPTRSTWSATRSPSAPPPRGGSRLEPCELPPEGDELVAGLDVVQREAEPPVLPADHQVGVQLRVHRRAVAPDQGVGRPGPRHAGLREPAGVPIEGAHPPVARLRRDRL